VYSDGDFECYALGALWQGPGALVSASDAMFLSLVFIKLTDPSFYLVPAFFFPHQSTLGQASISLLSLPKFPPSLTSYWLEISELPLCMWLRKGLSLYGLGLGIFF
jgi:hypothetical protein